MRTILLKIMGDPEDTQKRIGEQKYDALKVRKSSILAGSMACLDTTFVRKYKYPKKKQGSRRK